MAVIKTNKQYKISNKQTKNLARMLERMGVGQGHLFTASGNVTCPDTMKVVWKFLKKLILGPQYDPAIIPGYLPNGRQINTSQKHSSTCVYCYTIHIR